MTFSNSWYKKEYLLGLGGLGGGAGGILVAGGPVASGEFQIEKSLRFDDGADPNVKRTFSSSGNRKTWTWSGWVKRTTLGGNQVFFSAGDEDEKFFVLKFGDDKIAWMIKNDSNSYTMDKSTSASFEDTSAWYHIVAAVDTTQSNAQDRAKLYVNGIYLDGNMDFNNTSSLSQNTDYYVNKNVGHWIGESYQASQNFDGYIANVEFIDGKQLSPGAFGSFSTTKVWNPKALAFPTPNNPDGAAVTHSSGGTTVGNWNEPSYGVGEIFDGNISGTPGGACSDSSNWNGARYTLPSVVTVNSQVRVWTNDTDDRWGYDIGYGFERASNLNAPIGSSSPYVWTLPITTQFKGICCSDAQQIFGIEVDGIVLTDGQTDQTYAAWKAATSDNVNSFHLKFADSSTDAALGSDTLGNGDWTVTNISASTASDGINLDSLLDSPSNYGAADDTGAGGEVRGNYCTISPITTGSQVTLANGNLEVTATANGDGRVHYGTLGMSSGKWYAEFNSTSTANVGIANVFVARDSDRWLGHTQGGMGWYGSGTLYYNATSKSYGDTWTSGDTIGIAFDADGGNLYFYKNGTIQDSGTAALTGLTDGPYFFGGGEGGTTGHWNFGQRPFKYAAPTGYKCLCSTNLADTFGANENALEDLNDPSKYFDVKTYIGTGGDLDIKGMGFQPDLLWLKNTTDGSTSHCWMDAINGNGSGFHPDTDAGLQTGWDGVITQSFNSDGFTASSHSYSGADAKKYVSFAWDAGTAAVTASTDGDITPTAQWVNDTCGFGMAKYTGTFSSAGVATIGHKLSAPPEFIISKEIGNANRWAVRHSGLTNWNHILELQVNDDEADKSGGGSMSAPTNTVFGTNYSGGINVNSYTYMTYYWRSVPGYSKFGKYLGRGGQNFVYTGFKPRWVLIKALSQNGEEWMMFDSVRSGTSPLAAPSYSFNPLDKFLHAENGNANTSYGERMIHFTSTGIHFPYGGNTQPINNNGWDYIYCAFAEHPAKTARAV